MSMTGLRSIAIFEASKGLVALFVSLGIHQLAGDSAKQVAEKLVTHLHLNPANPLPNIIIRAAGELNNSRLLFLAFGAFVYSVIRFIEAYGLWNELRWVEWFALLSGAIYLPIEIYECFINTNLLSAALLSINLLIVWYIYNVLQNKHQTRN
jgi:uncharacterized membrane protein (DUF2068 family)